MSKEIITEYTFSLLRSMAEFERAYSALKAKAQAVNSFIDGLEVTHIEESDISFSEDEIKTPFERINGFYVLVLEEAGSTRAYIKACCDQEEQNA